MARTMISPAFIEACSRAMEALLLYRDGETSDIATAVACYAAGGEVSDMADALFSAGFDDDDVASTLATLRGEPTAPVDTLPLAALPLREATKRAALVAGLQTGREIVAGADRLPLAAATDVRGMLGDDARAGDSLSGPEGVANEHRLGLHSGAPLPECGACRTATGKSRETLERERAEYAAAAERSVEQVLECMGVRRDDYREDAPAWTRASDEMIVAAAEPGMRAIDVRDKLWRAGYSCSVSRVVRVLNAR